MKNDLTCGVTHDLLPSYVEGLLCEESRQAVDRHLADCPKCAAALSAMEAPEGTAVQEEGLPVDLDYLKKVVRHNRWKIAAAAVCTGLVLIGALLYQLYERGVPMEPQAVTITELSYTQAEGGGGTLHISLSSADPRKAFYGWGARTGDVAFDRSSLVAQEVLTSPLHSDESVSLDLPVSEDQREYWLGSPSGRLLWQNGVAISQTALDLMDAKTLYCGDPSAVGRIANVLRLPDRLGSYTVSLQTSGHPYGWTLELANPLNEEQLDLAACWNILALALVDNLEVSRLTQPEAGDRSMRLEDMKLTLTELVARYNEVHYTNWRPKASVKDYADTPADLQRLLLMLDCYYGTNLAALP